MQRTATNPQLEWPRWVTTGGLDLIVLLAAAAPLLFPQRFPDVVMLLALGSLAIPFVVRYRRLGILTRYSHANLPVLLLLVVFLPISLMASPLPLTISLPRATTLVWSIALFFTLANWPADVAGSHSGRTRITLPAKLYLLLGVLVGAVGLLGMRSMDKLFYIPLPDLALRWAIFGEGLATNEIAGTLTLFVPFAAALAFGALTSQRRRIGLVAGGVAVWTLAIMVLTQSRTALFATAVALALAGVLLVRPGWKWVSACLVIVGVVFLSAAKAGFLDQFIYAGANSWDSVIGPRLDVWQQGLFGLQDFALWGMGLGMFGTLAPRLYPMTLPAQAKILEDAHNLYLQSMLDLGVLGGLVFLSILIYAVYSLVRLMRHRRQGTLGRAWAVGLLVALVAHMLYSLTDAVALGTLAGIPLWFALGMAVARTRDAKPQLNPVVAALVGTLAVLLVAWLAWVTLPTNRVARSTAEALLTESDLTSVASLAAQTAETRCELHWQEGLLYHAQGEAALRDAAWAALLGCTGRYARFMPMLAPQNADLARTMIELQPGSPTGYFWLAELLTSTDPAAAILWYANGLLLAPQDGRRWGYLGDLLATADPDAALAAYLQACHNGDPGANGCLRAGALAEKQGHIAEAISYYRLSRFDGSLQRADELESQLAEQ